MIDTTVKVHFKNKGYDIINKENNYFISLANELYFVDISYEDILMKSDTKIPIKKLGEFCVYVLLDNANIIYVGFSKILLYRIGQHQSKFDFNRIFLLSVNDEDEAKDLEFKFICKFKPPKNGEIKSKSKVVNFFNESLY